MAMVNLFICRLLWYREIERVNFIRGWYNVGECPGDLPENKRWLVAKDSYFTEEDIFYTVPAKRKDEAFFIKLIVLTVILAGLYFAFFT